jgi:hypothetical protein
LSLSVALAFLPISIVSMRLNEGTIKRGKHKIRSR